MEQEETNIWYLAEWMDFLKLKQCDIAEKTGLNKAKTNRLYLEKSSFNNQIVIDISKALEIAPYELFMPPEEAMVVRILGIAEDCKTADGISIHFTNRMLQDLARSHAIRMELDRQMVRRMIERS